MTHPRQYIYPVFSLATSNLFCYLRPSPSSTITKPTIVMADVKLPVRTVPRKPRLDTLPQEVHDLIFEHASSPQTRLKHHLWPLLFVSRQMYQAVLPSMYRRVSFQVDSSVGSYEANYKLLQLADKENQGLMHIEEIRLYPRDELRRMPSVTAEYPDAIQLLAAVPKNQLRRFK